MLKIRIIAIGKLKNIDFKNSFNEYLKMISPYANIKVEELNAEPFFDKSDKKRIKQKESFKLRKCLDKFSTNKIFILDERGKDFDSEGFSRTLFNDEAQEIIFVVGGTLGLSGEILDQGNFFKISLSKLTFPHELVRVILVEQIYRAIAINKNKSYHY